LERRVVALIGVPYDRQSSYAMGASEAPQAIRDAWHRDSSNKYAEDGTLVDDSLVMDAGDIAFPDGADAAASISGKVDEILKEGMAPLCLGGDHSITHPVVKAFSRHHKGLGILHFDAHADLYDSYEGNRASHACPFARIMEEGLASRLVQVGIRTMTPHLREQAARFGVEVHEMKDWDGPVGISFPGPVYISIDVDALDPAFAPAVSHREPGGLSTRQVIETIQRFEGRVVGADIVEFNPSIDRRGPTDMVCAKMLKELAARLYRDSR
jgi:agmatinase